MAKQQMLSAGISEEDKIAVKQGKTNRSPKNTGPFVPELDPIFEEELKAQENKAVKKIETLAELDPKPEIETPAPRENSKMGMIPVDKIEKSEHQVRDVPYFNAKALWSLLSEHPKKEEFLNMIMSEDTFKHDDTKKEMGELYKVVDDLLTPPASVRHLVGLCWDIERNGLHNSVEVFPIADGRYKLASGEHRWTVFKILGKKEIPAIIRDKEPDLTDILAENLLRKNLTPIEQARAFALLLEKDKNMSVRKIAARFNMKKSTVQSRLDLLKEKTNNENKAKAFRIRADETFPYPIIIPTGGKMTRQEAAEYLIKAAERLKNGSIKTDITDAQTSVQDLDSNTPAV